MFKKVASAAALGAALFSNAAVAGIANTTMPVTATITGACTVTATTLDFGSIVTIIGVDTDTTATIDVNCTSALPYNIAIDDGTHAGAGSHNRRMASPAANNLAYQVYVEATRTTVADSVGANNTGFDTAGYGTGTGATQSITVYGRVPQQASSPPAATYTDTLGITVNY